MGNYPLPAKEQHKRKVKLAKIRQTMMIILMAIAGLYYMTVERSQVTNAAVVTNEESTETAMMEDVRQNATEKETKFTIEGFVKPTPTADEMKSVGTEETESKQTEVTIMAPLTAEQAPVEKRVETPEQIADDAGSIAQAVPNTAVNAAGVSATEIQTAAVADITALEAEDKRVNLNTATLEELDALPGVGPSTAKNIIAYREAHGGFAAPEEIMNVKRIGEKTFGKLKNFIKV